MRILIAGAGGVGAYFGGLLARAGADITLLARGENLRALSSQGLRMQSAVHGDFAVPVKTLEVLPAEPFDVIFVAVKSYQSAAVCDALAPAVGADTVIISLQNGVNAHLPFAGRYTLQKTLGGCCNVAATLIAPGVIEHRASGRMIIGEWNGALSERLQQIAAAVESGGIPVEKSLHIRERQWQKLVWNTGFNGLTALGDLAVDAVLARPEYHQTVLTLMRETVAVAQHQGIALESSLPEKMIENALKEPPGVETSMQVDRRMGRPLEWEIFQGFLSAEGRRLGVATPCNDMVGALLSAICQTKGRTVS